MFWFLTLRAGDTRNHVSLFLTVLNSIGIEGLEEMEKGLEDE